MISVENCRSRLTNVDSWFARRLLLIFASAAGVQSDCAAAPKIFPFQPPNPFARVPIVRVATDCQSDPKCKAALEAYLAAAQTAATAKDAYDAELESSLEKALKLEN